MKRRKHHRLQETDAVQNLEGLIMPVDEIHVSTWHRERDGRGDPEQVHVSLHIKKLPPVLKDFITVSGAVPPMVVRLKSRDACDALITALQNHRDEVFPGEKEQS